ncbi:MAG: hypothetical protein H7835_00280 [Magnetococcus sp. XQGC-1]
MGETLPGLDPVDLEALLQLIQEVIGIPFPPDRRDDLARHLRELTLAQGFQEQRDFVRWFLREAPPRQARGAACQTIDDWRDLFFSG